VPISKRKTRGEKPKPQEQEGISGGNHSCFPKATGGRPACATPAAVLLYRFIFFFFFCAPGRDMGMAGKPHLHSIVLYFPTVFLVPVAQVATQ
jgi:hypothetical protein